MSNTNTRITEEAQRPLRSAQQSHELVGEPTQPMTLEQIVIPEELLKNTFASESDLMAWENTLIAFFTPLSELFTPFPIYFRLRCYEFRVLAQLLPTYLGLGVKYDDGLEIGCGFGFKTILLSRLCERLLGIDIPARYESHVRGHYNSSVEMARLVVNEKFGFQNVDFKEMLPDRLEIDSNSRSFLFSEYTLEHIPDLPKAIREMHRVLATGGVMIHVVPNTKDAMIQFMNAQINLTFKDFVALVWKRLRKIKTQQAVAGNGIVVPQCHSEFINRYSQQIEIYTLENYLFPMLDAGFRIEQIVSTREHNDVIVARK